MTVSPHPADSTRLKSCCANLYESDWARLLLGDTFHPGGLALTERLGELLNLQASHRVLDAASGKGRSAIHLAQRFGCEAVGVDYSARSVEEAIVASVNAGMSSRVRFKRGDAESLPLGDATFDTVICECAFCTFPDKQTASLEFARVLKPGGWVGLSDLTRSGPLPEELQGLLAWVACIADARPVEQYASYLQSAGFSVERIEPHDEALGELVRGIQAKLLGAELMMKLKQIDLPGVSFEQAKRMARAAAEAVRTGNLGYSLLIGRKPS